MVQVYSNQPAVLSLLDDGASWADLSDTRLPLDGKFYTRPSGYFQD